jgi:hypothetical protein
MPRGKLLTQQTRALLVALQVPATAPLADPARAVTRYWVTRDDTDPRGARHCTTTEPLPALVPVSTGRDGGTRGAGSAARGTPAPIDEPERELEVGRDRARAQRVRQGLQRRCVRHACYTHGIRCALMPAAMRVHTLHSG